MGDRKMKQKITPTLMFVGEQCGKAEAAINFYTSAFNNAEIGEILRYGKGEEPLSSSNRTNQHWNSDINKFINKPHSGISLCGWRASRLHDGVRGVTISL